MRIVLVDPSRTILKIVTRLLEAEQHQIFSFTDGPEALEYIKSNLDAGVLITSAELPSMSGIELCWETRLLASYSRPIYVILMSSNQDRNNLIESLDSGADDFISKPPVAEELYARLRTAKRLATVHHELILLATTDPLTGVLNRRAFFERAQQICARETATPTLSAIMFDADHFKRINDDYGHAIGDEALRAIAKEATTESNFVGRLGGEEFAILIEGCTSSAAVEIAERLRLKVTELQFKTQKGIMTLTCSFGVSDWKSGDTIDRLLKRADSALYEAKETGRNRVVHANAEQWEMPDVDRGGITRSAARR